MKPRILRIQTGSGTAFFVRGHLKTYGFYVVSRFRGVKKSMLRASWLLWAAIRRPRASRAPKSRPRRPRSGPGAAPRAPKSHPRAPRSHPRAAQERPRPPNKRPRAPKSAQERPRRPRSGPKRFPRGPRRPKFEQNHGSTALPQTLFENNGQKIFRNHFTQDQRKTP